MNYRSRLHGLLFYPGSEGDLILEKLRAFEHVVILHDKDLDDEGKIKKPHYHAVLCMKNASWQSAISKEIGLSERFIQQIRNEEASLCYLTHKNEEKKHQYNVSEVSGSSRMLGRMKNFLEKETKGEGERCMELFEFIEKYPGNLTVSVFAKHCASVEMWDVFRRSSFIFLQIIKEKNGGIME